MPLMVNRKALSHDLLTVKEAADRLSVSVRWVYKLIAEKTLRPEFIQADKSSLRTMAVIPSEQLERLEAVRAERKAK